LAGCCSKRHPGLAVAGNSALRRDVCGGTGMAPEEGTHTMRGILLWLVGIPIPIIILLWLFGALG